MSEASPNPSDSDRMARVVNLREFEALARERMAPDAFEYVVGGSDDEITLRENSTAFERRRLRPRILVDVSEVDLSTEVLGSRLALPVGVCPMAYQRLADPEAEVPMSRAAADAGGLFCLSTLATRSMEDCAAAIPAGSNAPRWFQLYAHRDRAISEGLVKRAEAAGYGAIAVTVDLQTVGNRERDVRYPEPPPEALGHFPMLADEDGSLTSAAAHGLMAPFLTWADLRWLVSITHLPIVVKGVMTAEDAIRAVRHGAAGIWVSNHGGRQLDRARATIDVLEDIVTAVGGQAEVYLDGGVRRGSDVVTALALGAQAVFIGRPFYFALAAGGEAGVRRAFEILTTELRTTMMLLGVPKVGRLSRRVVVP